MTCGIVAKRSSVARFANARLSPVDRYWPRAITKEAFLGYDVIVIGGGYFGASLATRFGERGQRILLLEAGDRLLGRASAINQARVHAGYHYPRSYLTAFRSRTNAPRFIEQYRECIHDDFAHYYAIGRAYSKVTALQFRRFCDRIGAPIAEAPKEVRALFDPALIEDVFQVPEYAFDVDKLRARVERDLAAAGVDVRLESHGVRVRQFGRGIGVTVRCGGEETEYEAEHVHNCTYSQLNTIHAASGLPIVPLKHELTEMVLVRPPEELRAAAVTVMCGPYFSLVPYPSRGLHTLSHVRYTPHRSWNDGGNGVSADPSTALGMTAELGMTKERATTARPGSSESHFPHMVRDSARYLPAMRRAEAVESIWEVKTVLPRSEVDDSRPILFSRDHGLRGFHCVIGSKIDNAYDMLDVIDDSAPAMDRSA